MYVLVAAVLSLVADPLCRRIDNKPIYKGKSLPSWAAALITMLVIFLVMSGMLSVFIPVLIQEANTIANLDTAQIMNSLHDPLAKLEEWYLKFNIGGNKPFEEFAIESLKNTFTGKGVSNTVSGIFNSLSDFVAATFSIFFIAFFLLKEEGLLLKAILYVVPQKDEKTRPENI